MLSKLTRSTFDNLYYLFDVPLSIISTLLFLFLLFYIRIRSGLMLGGLLSGYVLLFYFTSRLSKHFDLKLSAVSSSYERLEIYVARMVILCLRGATSIILGALLSYVLLLISRKI